MAAVAASPAAEEDGSYTEEVVRGPRERSEGGWVTQEVLAAKLWGWERKRRLPPRWLTLQHRDGGLGPDPGGRRVLVQVVAPWVVAGPALVGAGVVQRQPGDSQHAHAVCAVRRVDGDAALAGAVPQLPERVATVDLGVPPLDLRRGVSHHVAVQLEGVACELGLG